MKSAPAVIDTNVVVSGVLTKDSPSPTVRILDGMLAGRFRFLLSVDLLAEYRDVPLAAEDPPAASTLADGDRRSSD